MKKYSFLFIIIGFFLCIQNLNAQTIIITGAEYFFDEDPGTGNGNPLSPEDGIFDSTIEQVISNAYHNLEPGVHVVNVRGKNSEGNWGPVTSMAFRVTETVQTSDDTLYIADAEFFFDNDPGEGNGFQLNAIDGNFDHSLENVAMNNIDLSHFSEGDHTVFVRGMRSDNQWGEVKSYPFIIDRTAPIAIISNKPSDVTNDTSINLIISGNDVSQYRYQLNDNNLSDEIPITDSINISNLSDGNYEINVYARDNAGNWQSENNATKCSWRIDTEKPVITGLSNDTNPVQTKTWYWIALDSSDVLFRYQIDQNSDWATPFGIFTDMNSAFINDTFGIWFLHVQAKDAAGNISDVVTVSANLTEEVINKPPTPTGLEIENISNSRVDLIWDFASDIANISYIVYRSEMENGVFYKVNNQEISINHVVYGKIKYTDQGLQNDRTYYYKVKSFLNDLESESFSNQVFATPHNIYNFQCKPINKTSKIVKVNSTVKYYFQLFNNENFEGKMYMTCNGLPDYLKYEFSINKYVQGSTLEITDLPASVTLKIYAGSAANSGEHEFDLTVQNTWPGGSSQFMIIPMKLTVVPNKEDGVFIELDKTVVDTFETQNARNKKQLIKISSRKIEIPVAIDMGEAVEIYGAISSYATGEKITISLIDQNGDTKEKIVETTPGGEFSDKEWIANLGLGTYEIKALWTDSGANVRMSNSRKFTIVKGKSELTCLRKTDSTGKINEDFSITGDLNPIASYDPIILRVIAPNDYTIKDYNLQLDDSGHYEIFDTFFSQKGVWKFKTYWQGNDTHIGCESDTLSVPVGMEFGRAIILAGGESEINNAFWNVTQTLSIKAYNDFKFMGFTNDLIYYSINSKSIDINFDGIPDDVVDMDQPTVNNFLESIENMFESELNADSPLFIYIIGHGTSDARFKVLGSDQYVSAAQINTALDNLQNKTGCMVVVILESCFSGNFIKGLMGNNRVLISSTDNQRYIIDSKGEIVFSRFLFSNLSEGDSLGKAFQKAKHDLMIFGYPPPLMICDSTNNTLSADNIFVTGQIHYGERVEINEVLLENIVEDHNTSLPLTVKASGDVDIEKVWAVIIPPNANVTGTEQTITYPEIALTYDNEAKTYKGMLTNLDAPGIYKIAIMAKNVLHEVSPPFVEYVSNTSIVKPGDINGDNRVDISDAITALKIVCLYNEEIPSTLADVNGDNQIGLHEVVYIIKTIGYVSQ